MAHVALIDKSINVLSPYYANAEQHSPHTIELDCAPGMVRPWDLLPGIIEGTGLTFENPESVKAFFGEATYEFPNTTCEQWIEAQPTLIKRITALYHSGLIRYGTW